MGKIIDPQGRGFSQIGPYLHQSANHNVLSARPQLQKIHQAERINR